jgi:hypothetical protein
MDFYVVHVLQFSDISLLSQACKLVRASEYGKRVASLILSKISTSENILCQPFDALRQVTSERCYVCKSEKVNKYADAFTCCGACADVLRISCMLQHEEKILMYSSITSTSQLHVCLKALVDIGYFLRDVYNKFQLPSDIQMHSTDFRSICRVLMSPLTNIPAKSDILGFMFKDINLCTVGEIVAGAKMMAYNEIRFKRGKRRSGADPCVDIGRIQRPPTSVYQEVCPVAPSEEHKCIFNHPTPEQHTWDCFPTDTFRLSRMLDNMEQDQHNNHSESEQVSEKSKRNCESVSLPLPNISDIKQEVADVQRKQRELQLDSSVNHRARPVFVPKPVTGSRKVNLRCVAPLLQNAKRVNLLQKTSSSIRKDCRSARESGASKRRKLVPLATQYNSRPPEYQNSKTPEESAEILSLAMECMS